MTKIYFKRNTVEHGMFQDTKMKTELPDIKSWEFIEHFYPNYYTSNEIAKHDDLSCYFDNEKSRVEIEKNNEDLTELDEQGLKTYFSELDDYLRNKAAKHFYEMLISGAISIINVHIPEQK